MKRKGNSVESKIFKQVVGIDVSMDKLDIILCYINNEQEIITQFSTIIDNKLKAFKKLTSMVEKYRIKEVPLWYNMEATGVYYEDLAYYLSGKESQVSVILPNKGKQYCKSLNQKGKTDKMDAKMLARYGCERKLECWKEPSPFTRQLRELTRERITLVQERTRVKCQLHAKDHSFEPAPQTIGRKNKFIEFINNQIDEVEAQIEALLKSNDEVYQKIVKINSIKGLGIITIATVVAETDGFSRFENIRQLVSFTGLDIKMNESGRFQGKTTISRKGNSFIRSALYMPAISAATNNPDLKIYYQRISSRKKVKKMAVIPVARKLLILIYTLWKKDTEYIVGYQSAKAA